MASQFHLADLFERVAATVPDRLAIVSDSARLTFAQLDERASRLAAGLAAHGIGRGDKVGPYLHNSPAFLESFIAACKLGAVPYNVNYRYRADAGYKLPRALVWVDEIRRSPAGKQDYQWAKAMAEQAS